MNWVSGVPSNGESMGICRITYPTGILKGTWANGDGQTPKYAVCSMPAGEEEF